ncbi:MAG: iron ABC transporter permease [Prolixibacteraceae bacterium]|nr:iron ABC transporter permease [Prolixibacteraceae bacterium]MBN2772754.1 iron ABC transporter permease [Prolixibacteraceae bacterium]
MQNTDHKNHSFFILILLGIIVIVFFILDLLLGSVTIPFSKIYSALFHPEISDTAATILRDFRLPKALTAIVTGAALSVSGLQMQTVFRNPLAGPYVLGISAGASLGVALFVLGFSSVFISGIFSATGAWSLALIAWLGAFAVMMLVLYVSTKVNDIMTLLILGILFTAATGAIVSILQYFSNESMLKAFIIWTMGSLGSVTKSQLLILLPAVILGIFLAFLKMKALNAFLLGENYARSLGVNIIGSRLIIFLSTSLLAGTITAFCGPIGFIGIAVPHIARVFFRTADHMILLPATILIGSALMLFSDIVSQLPGMQTTLPVNSVTALIGIPVIIWMIVKNKRFQSV